MKRMLFARCSIEQMSAGLFHTGLSLPLTDSVLRGTVRISVILSKSCETASGLTRLIPCSILLAQLRGPADLSVIRAKTKMSAP